MQEPAEVLETALAWLEAGRNVALATVLETGGSSPRPVGSNLVVAAVGYYYVRHDDELLGRKLICTLVERGRRG